MSSSSLCKQSRATQLRDCGGAEGHGTSRVLCYCELTQVTRAAGNTLPGVLRRKGFHVAHRITNNEGKEVKARGSRYSMTGMGLAVRLHRDQNSVHALCTTRTGTSC